MRTLLIFLALLTTTANAQLFNFRRGNCSNGSCSQKTVEYNGRTYRLNSNGRCCNSNGCAMGVELFGKVGSEPKNITLTSVVTKLHSTPDKAVDELLRILDPKPGEVIYDLGCGDGKILIAAAQKYGTRGLGVELNPATAVQAKHQVKLAGLADRITILTGDAAYQDLSGADYVVMYLYPETMERILPRLKTLKPGVEVISYQHDIPDLETSVTSRQIDGNEHRFYLYPRREKEESSPPLAFLR